MAGNTAHGLMVLGAVAGSAAIGSIAGFIGRPGASSSEDTSTAPDEASLATSAGTHASTITDERPGA